MVSITKCKACGQPRDQVTCNSCNGLCKNCCPSGHGTFDLTKATQYLHICVYDRGDDCYVMHKVEKGKAYTTGPHKTLKSAYKYLITILEDL